MKVAHFGITAAISLGLLALSPALAQRETHRAVRGMLLQGQDFECDAQTGMPEGTYTTDTWPGGIVPYRFSLRSVTATNQQQARDAMDVIEANCDVVFIPRTNEPAYLLFVSTVNTTCTNSSGVGYSGSIVRLNMCAWQNQGTLIHELGHALGLWHEQSRPDRDTYIEVHTSRICSGLNNWAINGIPFGPYDFESIMQYGRYSRSGDGTESISVRPGYEAWRYYMGQGDGPIDTLSNGDIWVLTELYGGDRPPRVFGLTTPANRALVGAAWAPQFEWTPSELADSYTLQVDDDPSFSSPEIDTAVAGTTYTHGSQLTPGTIHYWRVIAENTIGVTEAKPQTMRCFLTEAAVPSILHVDDDAAPGGDGASWASPMNDLQDALVLADCADGMITEVRIAQGLYKPDRGTGDRTMSYPLVAGVEIKGGYAGIGAPNPNARDIAAFPTILTGDLAGDDLPGFVNNSENSYHLFHGVGVEQVCTIDGLTIESGNADGIGRDMTAYGGAIHSRGGDVVVRDCVIRNCSAGNGGGLNIWDGASVEVIDTLFSGNRAANVGGALHKPNAGSVTLDGCSFIGNTAFWGGAVTTFARSTGVVSDCLFEGNTADEWGGALSTYLGIDLTIDRCVFKDNRANAASALGGQGGALANYGNEGCSNRVSTTMTVNNSLFTGNTSATTGGAMTNDSNGDLFVINSTVIDNGTVPGGGGGIATTAVFGGASNLASVIGTIVRGNAGGQLLTSGAVSGTSVGYSNVEGGAAGAGNFDADPLFVDPGSGDFRLGPTSSSIDAGDNTALAAGITTDLAGLPRFHDDTGMPDRGVAGGTGGAQIVDVGAHEFQGTTCFADCDQSTGAGKLDLFDFLCFQSRFVGADPYACDCDTSTGQLVCDLFDFLCFQGAFVGGCP